jgi:hypothetical protein
MLRRLLILSLFVLFLLVVPSANATTITPTRFDDPGGAGSCPTDCSLRQAIAFAGPNDSIQLLAGTYAVSQGTPLVNSNLLELSGAGAKLTTIDANDTSAVFSNTGLGALINLTIANGKAITAGGGIVNTGTLSLQRVSVTSNIAQGIGIMEGGGIANQGTLYITDSSVTHNFANSTNGSASNGGGLMAFTGSSIYIANTTFSDDFTLGIGSGGGGAIAATSGAGVYIFNSTLGANNSVTPSQSGGQISTSSGANVQIRNSVIAQGWGPSGSESCSTATNTLTSFGGNVDQTSNGQCDLSPGTGDIVGVDPQLGALGDNGGSTETQMPAATSPAIGFGTVDNCAFTSPNIAGGDQRGGKRTAGTTCDAGSVERNSLAQLSLSGKLGPAAYPSTPLTLTITNNGPDDVVGASIPGTSCTVAFLAAGASSTCTTTLAWNGVSGLAQSFTASANVNSPTGSQPTLGLSTAAPRLSTVSLRPPKVTPTKSGATLGTKKVKGAAVLKYTGLELSSMKVPVQAPVAGNIKSGKCVKRKKGAKATGRKCTLWRTLTTVTLKKLKPAGKLYLTGRVKNKSLKNGKYRLALTATSSDGGVGSPWYLAFSVK